MRITTFLFLLWAGIGVGGLILEEVEAWWQDSFSRRPDPRIFEGPLWEFATEDWQHWDVAPSENEVPRQAPVLKEMVIEELEEGGPVVGTAFSVTRSGYWLTARHVVDNCGKVLIQVASDTGIRVRKIVSHPKADVSLLETDRGFPPLAVAKEAGDPENGFHFGFPRAIPGALHTTYLGQGRIMFPSRVDSSEPVFVWTEESRVPNVFESLGGISGGPVVDDAGRVIGVILAESARRGRTYSATPATVGQTLDLAGADITAPDTAFSYRQRLTADDYAKFGRAVIRGLTVARVICRQ